MQLLDEGLAEYVGGAVYDHINTLKMIGGFHNVIDLYRTVRHADRVRFKDKARLVVGQSAALDVIGVIGQIDLNSMIDSAMKLCCLFCPQYVQQRFRHVYMLIEAVGLFGGCGNVPGFSRQKAPVILPWAQ